MLVGGVEGVIVGVAWLVWDEVGEGVEAPVVVGVGERVADDVRSAVGEGVGVGEAGGWVSEGSGLGLGGCIVSVGRDVRDDGEGCLSVMVWDAVAVISGGSSIEACVLRSSPV